MSITICNGQRVEGYDPNRSNNSPEAVAAHVAACHAESHVGKVLKLRELNGYDDSDFYALVWDEEQQQTREITYATTRGWTYHNHAGIDATREVIEKAVAHRAAVYLADWEREHGKRVEKGMTARVTVKGETLTGTVAWVGQSKAFTAWEARYGTPQPRYGIRVEGRAKLIFRNADSPTLAVDVPAWTDEDRAEMIARAESRARHDFREALRLADEREPLPSVPGPGDIVDSQEEDGTGMRLYAIGEAFADDDFVRAVAEGVIDQGAAEYSVMGHRADGAKIPAREVTVAQAMNRVALWAGGEGTRIEHDGRGVVRMVREDGARLMLAPVRPFVPAAQEGAQGPGVRHGMKAGPNGTPVCACGLADRDALIEHWVSTGVIPVVPVVEMSGVWRITGRGAEVFAEGANKREAWADAARQGFERDYFHAIKHLSVAELEALTAPAGE